MIEKVVVPKRKPLIIEEVTSEKIVVAKKTEKRVVKTKIPIPEGHVRVIALVDFEGMTCHHYEGDVIDLPDRRFKTLVNRGIVREYKGYKEPGER
jgi:hypothetical protein